jgi:hypothetical protein
VESAVGGVEQFRQAVIANGDVGRNQNPALFTSKTRQNAEINVAVRGPIRNHEIRNPRERRNLSRQSRKECLDGLCAAFYLNGNACLCVGDETCQAIFGSEPKNKRAKPHTLHDPRNFNSFAHKNSDE